MNNTINNYIIFGKKCLKLIASDKLMFGIFLFLSIISAITEGLSISLLVPLLQSQIGTGGFSNIPILGHIEQLFNCYNTSERIKIMAIIMLLVVLARSLIQYTVVVMGHVIPLKIQSALTIRSYTLLMRVRMSYIAENNYGALCNDIGQRAREVSQMLVNIALMILNSAILMAYIAMMFLISWRLSLLAFGFMLFMMIILRLLSSKLLYQAGEHLNNSVEHLNQIIMESISGMKLIRLNNSEDNMTEKFIGILCNVISSQRRRGILVSISSPILDASSGIFICVILFISAVIHENDNQAWIGSVMIFLFLMFRLIGPVTQIDNARSNIAGYIPIFEGLENFYRHTEEQRQHNGIQRIERLTHDIVFDSVSFSYGNGRKQVLNNISTRIVHGQMTAIVGPSGAGKSTLINLITRLYDPQLGRILIGDNNINELDVKYLRRRISVVSQDIFIFNDTIANNISFGLDNVSNERIHEAVTLAAASDFVDALPNGYNTMLGDRGMRLSGGQQQRIAIARAILANPDLLIMDEATSHLDTFTEHAIQRAIDHLSRDRTLLVIAHRLSTIRRADKVIVMKDGLIVEEGRHSDLIKQRGAYWDMVDHQRLDLINDD